MALQVAGNTVVGDAGNGSFNVVSVTSNGYIEIPDAAPSVNINSNPYITLTSASVTINNAMWSWWIKPLILRDKNASNNWTYACFTQSNGAVGVSITNHNTANSTQYTITPANTFSKDDHNASAVVTGNNKAYIFIQGRTANSSVLNPNNMFYIEFDEGTSPAGKNLVNVTFSTAPTATASYYPNAFNANGKFILLGRQQVLNTANQWLAVTGDYPVSNLSTPKGLFRSTYTWPYFALRRSYEDKDVINFAQGWHPYDSTSNNNIYFGKILRNGNTGPWDVYSNNAVIGNLTTGSGLPFDEADFELVFANPGGNNSIRLFDVHDDAVAFGLFDKRINVVQYKVAYKTANTWNIKTICSGGNPFHGVQVRDYYGGMSIGERNKYNVTVSVEINNKWKIVEYLSEDSGNNWIVNKVTDANQYEVAGRPMEEVLSEDAHIYNSTEQLGCFSWFGSYDGSDFTTFSTNIASVRLAGTSANTPIDLERKSFFSTLDVAQNSYIEVVSDTLVSGYTSGGTLPPSVNMIDKFPFAADNNASDVGDLSYSKTGSSGQSSDINGYASAGVGLIHVTFIDRFPFSVDNNATYVGDLTNERQLGAGISSNTHGYMGGGTFPGPNVDRNTIDRFPFYMDVISSDVGDLLTTLVGGAGQQSSTHGYISGGGQNFPTPIGAYRTIQKFPFAASSTNSTLVGNLSANTRVGMGQSSSTHGYLVGGFTPGSPFYNTINKFPFATDTDSTNVATLTQARRQGAGQSSTTHGYASGGESPPASIVNTVDKFPFATDSNASDVGDLTVARRGVSGQQG